MTFVCVQLAATAFIARITRLATNFSPAYLRYDVRAAAGPGTTVFLGDSVLWGYRVDEDRGAVALLRRRGCRCRNLAFQGGNLANDYFIVRLLLSEPGRPARVVVEINQAVFNHANPDYRSLHPAVARTSDAMLGAADRARLTVPQAPQGLAGVADSTLASLVPLYAMRADVRETLYGSPSPPPLPPLRSELFAGAYDLVPLGPRNVGVRYLEATAAALHRAHVPMIAFFTPVDHELLHDYIDNDLYAANLRYLRALLERRGARVLDFDRAVPGNEFFDNAHLTPQGQIRLAGLLGEALGI